MKSAITVPNSELSNNMFNTTLLYCLIWNWNKHLTTTTTTTTTITTTTTSTTTQTTTYNDDNDNNSYNDVNEHGYDENSDKTKCCPQYTSCTKTKSIKKHLDGALEKTFCKFS
jgi:hypothetical protein